MFYDEFYFHHKRGLPRWERIGHPLDTLSVIAALSVPVFLRVSVQNIIVFCLLALISSFLVTKDEFVHSQECSPAENWLHAILFVLHPLVFLSTGIFWVERDTQQITATLSTGQLAWIPSLLMGQLCVTCFFMIYQTLYWNFLWKKK